MVVHHLLTAFDHFTYLQETHLRYLEQEAQPDIARLGFERARTFTELKNQLTLIRQQQRTRQEEAWLAQICQERFAALKAQDNLLQERLYSYHEKLRQQLTQLRQHKQALLSYGHAESSSGGSSARTRG
jgi:hypothetical protein